MGLALTKAAERLKGQPMFGLLSKKRNGEDWH